MKHIMRKIGLIFCAMVLLCTLIAPCFATSTADGNKSNNKTVVVGWTLSDGYEEMDKDGKASGYYYDYLQTLSYYTGWNCEFKVGSWSECLDWVQDGTVDIIPNVTKTDERIGAMEFSDSEAFVQICGIYAPSSSNKYTYGDFDAFDGMRIVGIKDSYSLNELAKYAQKNGFTYELVLCKDAAEGRKMIENGQADAMASATLANYEGLTVIAQYAPNSVFFATKKGNTELMSELNYGMQCIVNYYPDFDATIYNKNVADRIHQDVTLSQKEMDYIDSMGTITMLCGDSWYPYEYFNEETQEFDGISVQIMKEIARITGLDVKFSLDKGYSMSDFMSYGLVNAFTSMSCDSNWADDSKVCQTQPFLTLGVYQIFKNDATKAKTVALQDGGYVYRNVQKYYPKLEIKTYKTALDCIKAVMSEKADCTFMNEKEANYYLSYSKYNALKCRTNSKFNQSLCFGISEESDPMLLNVISKGLNSIDSNRMDEILAGSDIKPYESPLVSWFYSNPLTSASVCMVIGFFALAVLVLVLRAKKQRKISAEMEQKNEELALAMEETKEAVEAKSIFYSRMSHDMRTPMNGILGISALSLDESDPAIMQDNMKKIHETGEYLLGLINDTLDLQRMESGKFKLEPQVVSTEDLISSSIDMIVHSAENKGVTFRVNNDNANLQGYIRVDSMRLRQVFVNLLSNAVKFTPAGGTVELRFQVLNRDEKSVHDRITITDTGLGMSEDFVKNKLFQAFTQEHNALTDTYAGTGLGLSIVKTLIDMMGANISVESELGVGTKITVDIDFELVDEKEIIQKNNDADNIQNLTEELKGMNILLAEDHPLNAEITKRLLQKVDCSITWVKNGRECADVFAASAPSEFDVILMDIRMPVMDGLEATREIRASSHQKAQSVPIIAMTANAYPEDIQAALDAGMNAHLAKPVASNELYKAIYMAKKRNM